MVSRAIILAFALIAAVSADVSELPKTPIIIGGTNEFADVPFGVNPFGKNANVRPLPRPASLPNTATAPALRFGGQPKTLAPQPLPPPRPASSPITAAVTAPRFGAQPRALASQPLPAPRPFQSTFQQAQPRPLIVSQPLRALPVVDRSLLNEINAQILRQDQEVNPDGSYQFSFETSNGISRSESGTPKVLGGNPPVVAEQVTGSYSYSENGVPYEVTYVADENGYRAFGNHLPTPPPTPPHVLRLLEYLAKNARN